MVLAHMEGMEAETVVELGELKPVLVLLRQRETGTVILIEDTNFMMSVLVGS